MVKISVLNDDRCDESYCSSHGLSLFIESEEGNILFDVGGDDNFIKNAKKMDIDIDKADYIVLSHGHYDHCDGLKFIKNKKRLICHPASLSFRVSKRTGNFGGMPFTKEELEEKFDVVFSDKPGKICNNVYFLGEIERKTDFECKTFPMVTGDGQDDIVKDDSGIAIKTEGGLVVISGCGHSGICNTINVAKKVTGQTKVLAAIGGFHLKEVDDQTKKTVEFFRECDVKMVILAHCNSNEVYQYMKDNLQCEVLLNEVGNRYFL